MMTGKITDDDRLRLRQVLDEFPKGLLASGDSFELIFDTGCTKTGTGCKSDFVPGTLENLKELIQMEGIAGGLRIAQQGVVRYEVLDNKGEVQVLLADAYLIPRLQY